MIEEHSIRVLLVEDDEDDYIITRNLFSEIPDTPYVLDWVATYEDALATMVSAKHAVCLIDYHLGKHNGLELLREAVAKGCTAPIILLTGQGNREVDIEAMRIGAADFLVKGQINATLLERSIRYALERQRLLAELRNLSLVDELTGLYNRRGFLTLAQQYLKLARRTQAGAFLVFVDMDELKQINDTFGHPEGDMALIKTAEILRKTFRDSDLLARWAGDEFTVLATDVCNKDDENILARMQERLEEHNAQKPIRYLLSLSVGVAHFDFQNPCAIEELVAKADQAMYEQKRSKRRL